MRIDDFDLEQHSYPVCSYDYLEVRDGPNENATFIGRYCRNPPSEIISTFNYLWLKFETDQSISGRGFHATYTTTNLNCGGILKETTGTVSLSNGNNNSYEPNMNCKWIIVAPYGHVIQMNWVNFNLEHHGQCIFDYVAVYENSTATGESHLIGKYCGQKKPPSIITSFNMVTVNFVSDSSIGREGFILSYIFLEERHVCGGNYFSSVGVIRTPNFPNSYDPDLECTWVISAPAGRQIQLNVTDFVLENDMCQFDYLQIRNGKTASSPLIGSYCGINIPKLITSQTNSLYLFFKTDSSRSEMGFQIYWKSTSTGCGGTITSPEGSIVSPNYPETYDANTECLWKIATNQGSYLQLTVADLDLESVSSCSLDYIEFSEMVNKQKKILGKYCTIPNPPVMTTAGNKLSVFFRSDVSVQGRGFQLQYSTVCNNTVKGMSGVIESPNFPYSYPRNLNCLWNIEVSQGNNINISFTHIDLETSSGDQPCFADYIEIGYVCFLAAISNQ